MGIKYSNNVHSKALQNIPKLGFFVHTIPSGIPALVTLVVMFDLVLPWAMKKVRLLQKLKLKDAIDPHKMLSSRFSNPFFRVDFLGKQLPGSSLGFLHKGFISHFFRCCQNASKAFIQLENGL
jgi:hypothetical protein